MRTAPLDTPISAFREAFPLGSTNQVIVVDEDGRYAGMVIVAEAHAADLGATAVAARYPAPPGSHAAAAAHRAGGDLGLRPLRSGGVAGGRHGGERRQVIGLLSEAHALRRYSDASERQRRELLGEV